jgi:hypothetical protein
VGKNSLLSITASSCGASGFVQATPDKRAAVLKSRANSVKKIRLRFIGHPIRLSHLGKKSLKGRGAAFEAWFLYSGVWKITPPISV